MRQTAGLATMLLATLATGCVDRKFVITSDPPFAAVYHNGVYIGRTPVDEPFIYYGKHEFKVVKDNGETLVQAEAIKSPWYEFPPLDFISENLFPWVVRDVRRLHFVLPDKPPPATDDLKRAQELRERGQAIGAPRVETPLPPGAMRPGPVGPP